MVDFQTWIISKIGHLHYQNGHCLSKIRLLIWKLTNKTFKSLLTIHMCAQLSIRRCTKQGAVNLVLGTLETPSVNYIFAAITTCRELYHTQCGWGCRSNIKRHTYSNPPPSHTPCKLPIVFGYHVVTYIWLIACMEKVTSFNWSFMKFTVIFNVLERFLLKLKGDAIINSLKIIFSVRRW